MKCLGKYGVMSENMKFLGKYGVRKYEVFREIWSQKI